MAQRMSAIANTLSFILCASSNFSNMFYALRVIVAELIRKFQNQPFVGELPFNVV